MNMFGAMDRDMESDPILIKICGAVQELSDQITHNKNLSSSLQAQATSLKVSHYSFLSDK